MAIASGVGLLASMFCIARRASRYRLEGRRRNTHDLHVLRPFQEIVEVLLYRSWGSLSALNMSTIIASAKWSRTTSDDSIPRETETEAVAFSPNEFFRFSFDC